MESERESEKKRESESESESESERERVFERGWRVRESARARVSHRDVVRVELVVDGHLGEEVALSDDAVGVAA
eukprot:2668931-Pleurochrysis_carterae.AAC.1